MLKPLARLLVPAGALAAAAALAAPAPAAGPQPPPIFPALAGVVRDACTGLPIFGATETLVPLSGQVPPSPIRLGGLFAYPGLAPGGWALGVTAPGYQPIPAGAPVTDQTGVAFVQPGVPILAPNPPPILPAGAAVGEALTADIRLSPGAPCGPNGPPIVPALAGDVRDAATGRLLANATLTLVPLDNQVPPSPIRLGGLFSYPALAAGAYALHVTAPGHTAIGSGNPTGDQPGIPFLSPEGPPILPAGDSASIGLALDVQLPAG
jgi:hypothetical protein